MTDICDRDCKSFKFNSTVSQTQAKFRTQKSNRESSKQRSKSSKQSLRLSIQYHKIKNQIQTTSPILLTLSLSHESSKATYLSKKNEEAKPRKPKNSEKEDRAAIFGKIFICQNQI